MHIFLFLRQQSSHENEQKLLSQRFCYWGIWLNHSVFFSTRRGGKNCTPIHALQEASTQLIPRVKCNFRRQWHFLLKGRWIWYSTNRIVTAPSCLWTGLFLYLWRPLVVALQSSGRGLSCADVFDCSSLAPKGQFAMSCTVASSKKHFMNSRLRKTRQFVPLLSYPIFWFVTLTGVGVINFCKLGATVWS